MATLDTLDIQITASTHKAIESIDRLINTLGKLSDAFYIKGIDRFIGSINDLSSAIGRINSDNLGKVSDALGKLSSSAKTLSSIGNSANQAGDGISRLAKEIASDFNITDNNAIQHLTQHIRELYQSTDQSSLTSSVSAINELIMKYSQFEKEMGGVNQEVMDFLKNTKIHLDNGWAKELRGDHKWIRATIGLLNTTKEGGLEASAALKQMQEMGAGVDYTPDNNDALRAIAEWIRGQKEARTATISFDEALKEHIITYSALDVALERIANAAGLTTERLGNMALNGPSEETTAGFQQMTVMLERLENVGNPFENLVMGLQELGSIELSDSLGNLNQIKDTISAIGNKSGRAAGESLSKIAGGMQALSGVEVPQFGDELAVFTQQMRSLGSKTIVNASTSLSGIANGLNALKGVGNVPQIGGITELAQSLSVFGRKTAKEAATVIPQLATAFRGLIETLSKAPLVSQNVIDLANAMANLAGNTRAVSPATRKASSGIDLFSKRAKNAHKSTFSLAAAIGKLYATYWTLFRVIGWFGKSIDIASDLKETQNVVDHVFGDMKYRMEDFSKTAVETVGMSELTAKKIGSRFQSMGKNMGITDAAIKRSDEFVQKVTGDYLKASDSVADMSINLTKLAGDMASFYNVDYEDVAQDMEAVYTGMTRPLRKYGLDLTVATLKEWALANGLNADIKNMTQAEKTMLRYQYVMANTTAAQGDFERTINTWANQTRVAGENLKKLQIILGQIGIYSFKPLVHSFNNAMNDILHLAESTFNSLGTIFGWQIEITDVGVIDDLADGLEDVEDGYDGAGKEAKKFKNFLLGIDELNLLPDDKDKGNGSGDLAGIGAAASGIQDSLVNMRETEKGFDSIYDTLYKLGARIAEVQKEWYKGIDWDSVFDKAESFGKGLASFLNGYLADAELFYQRGRFIANGINTVAHAIYGFFHEFDGYQLGKDLGFAINGFTQSVDFDTINKAGYEMAHDIAETVNGFFENVNWKQVGKTIVEGFNVAVRFVSTIWNEIHWDIIGQSLGDTLNGLFENWDYEEMARLFHGKIQALFDLANNLLSSADFVMIGQKIGQFLSELHLEEFADDLAALLWNVLKAAFELLPTMFDEAPVETALLLTFAGSRLTGFGNGFGNSLAGAMASGLKGAGVAGKLGTVITMDLDAIVTSGSLLVQATAIGEAIAGGIIAAFAGYHVGLKIHDLIFEEDEMWSEPGAIVEAVKNFEWWDDAVGQLVKEIKTNVSDADNALNSLYGIYGDYASMNFGISGDMSWGDVKQGLASGAIQMTEADFAELKTMLEKSGNSYVEVNTLVNELKDARDQYLNGFKPWLENQSDIQYALEHGTQYHSQIMEDAYKRYQNVVAIQEEIDRKAEGLANSPTTRYNQAKQIEENRVALEGEIQAWNGLSTAQQNFARIAGQMPEHIIDLPKSDTLDYTKKSIGKMANEFKNFGKTSADAISNAIANMFNLKDAVYNVSSESADVTREMTNVFGAMDSTGSGVFTGQARSIENLNTKLLTTKEGLDRIVTAVDEIGNRKDKTNVLKDSFDGVKGKVEEIGSIFSFDNMSSMFSAIPKAFMYAWKDALNVMKIMWTEIANWINANAKIEIPKTKIGKNEIGGGTVQLRIPRFDVGGSIPNDGSLFFANEKGPEVMANMGSRTGIMNTDQMEAAIANGMMKALAAGGQNVTVVLEGDASNFFTAMVRENNNAIMRVGASPLRV